MTIVNTTASLKNGTIGAGEAVEPIGETPIYAGNTETESTIAFEDGCIVLRLPYNHRRSASGKSTLLAAFSGTAKDFGHFGNVRLSGSVFIKDAPARKVAASGGVSAASDPSSSAAALLTLTNGMIANGMKPEDALAAATRALSGKVA
jgi:hypothetical protein